MIEETEATNTIPEGTDPETDDGLVTEVNVDEAGIITPDETTLVKEIGGVEMSL